MIRVAVFDSCPVFELGLTELLLRSAGFRLVDATLSVTDDLPALIDVLLLDVNLLEPDPMVAFIERAAGIAPILLTTQSTADRTLANDCLRAGATAALDRRVSTTVLLSSIRAVAAGFPVAHTENDVVPESAAVVPMADLSQRERQVLHQIAQGMTHDQIARRMNISRNTVDTYVKRIRAKLGVGNKAELTKVAILQRGGK